MKRLVSLLLVFAFVFSLMAGMEITSNAGTNGHTQVEAISWLNDRLGTQVGDGQCPALAREYYAYLGYSVSGDGKDYEYNVPSGWTKTYYSSGFIPQPGDVAVWRKTNSTAGAKHGHVAIVASATNSGMVCYEQGDSASKKVRKYDWGYSSVTCFIHPDFAPDTPPSNTTIQFNEPYYGINEQMAVSFYSEGIVEKYIIQIWFESQCIYSYETTQNNLTLNCGHFGPGTFGAYVTAYNSAGSCTSQTVSFRIANTLSNPQISINKNSFSLNENITFNVSCEGGADYYGLQIWEGTNVVYQESFTGHQINLSANTLGEGQYAAFISCVNRSGTMNTETLSFSIHNLYDVRYIVPTLNAKNTILTFSSFGKEYTVDSDNGIFEITQLPAGVYTVYAKQKNSLQTCLGTYCAQAGECINNEKIILPLGDVNNDNVIDIADLSMLLAKGNYGESNTEIDLTGDGMITIDDIAVALQVQNYGKASAKIV